MSDQEIKVPNIGEFKDVEVVEVLVSNDQLVSKNDPLITIESDKSSVEIPATFGGKVKSMIVKVGDKVSEGDVILILESNLASQQEVKEEDKIIEQSKKPEIIKTIKREKKNNEIVSASPKVRKFARELGADINQVLGSQDGGRIIEDDIKNFISSKINNKSKVKEKLPKKIQSEFEHADFGEIEVKNIPRVKKLASNYLVILGQQFLM